MRTLLATTAALALGAGAATAGGVDRSGQSVDIIFEEGSHAELSFGYVEPSVSGTATAASPTPGVDSDVMSPDYFQIALGYKQQINENVDVAVIFDQPFGADVDYEAGTGYFAQDSTAELDAYAVTGIVQYTLPTNFSVYGGVRIQTFEAEADIPFVTGGPPLPNPGAPYMAEGDRDTGFGYLLGAAYERPDIALRVALTYNSAIEHELDTSESSALGASTSTTTVDTPQSVNLEFQSGVAPDTLVFGTIRWVNWSDFDITPADYETLTGGSLVSYDDDTYSYTLGVGRRFTEQWSAAVSVGYEAQTGGFTTNLGPTDGYWNVGVGATYTIDNLSITGGLRYTWIGDAETSLGTGVAAAEFEDNDAVALGLQLSYAY